MTLPRLLLLTDRAQSERAGRGLPDTVAQAVDAGVRAVVFREKDLPDGERHRLAAAVADVVAHARALLVVASDVSLAHDVGACGVHLASTDHWPAAGPVEDLLVGRSCHDSDEIATAALCGCAYVTLSPVFATDSKPGYGPALEVSGLAAGCAVAKAPPVFALGGVAPGRAAQCLAAGAAGVAVMGSVMGAGDPAVVVRSLLAELS